MQLKRSCAPFYRIICGILFQVPELKKQFFFDHSFTIFYIRINEFICSNCVCALCPFITMGKFTATINSNQIYYMHIEQKSFIDEMRSREHEFMKIFHCKETYSTILCWLAIYVSLLFINFKINTLLCISSIDIKWFSTVFTWHTYTKHYEQIHINVCICTHATESVELTISTVSSL